jgi:hypothetical protein
MRLVTFLLFVSLASVSAQTPSQPVSTPLPTVSTNGGIDTIAVSPQVVTTIQVGQVQTLKFRALLATGQSTQDFSKLPVTFVASDDGTDVTAEVMKCRIEVGECTLRSSKPRMVQVGVYLNNMFGLQGVTVNFANFRSNLPARMDVTASQAQAQEGTFLTLTATSPVTVEGPVSIKAYMPYAGSGKQNEKYAYFPAGVRYGQRIEINTEEIRPLSFRGRPYYAVEMSSNGQVVAQGYGTSVASTEMRNIDAAVDDAGELVFTVVGAYNPSADYTMVLLRGDQFRLELAQSRNELFVYEQGGQTKIVFNRGSLGENAFYLPSGLYTVSLHGYDRSSGIGWDHSRADALSLNRSLIIH